MKIQCACGTKYAFDVTPEMVRSPIRFVCQSCGQDNSATINQLIRQEFAGAASVPAPVSAPAGSARVAPPIVIAPPPANYRPSPSAIPAPALAASAQAAANAPGVPPNPPPPPPGVSSLRVSLAHATSAPAPSTSASAAPAVETCAKHAGLPASHRCLVCQKSMCPKCMEVFGFVCSAYCKSKAENQGIVVPSHSGTRAKAEARQWRRIGLMVTAVLVAVFAFLGTWTWYAWVGSVPKTAFSLRFQEVAFSGQVRVPTVHQAVILHGGRLVRHDTKAKQEVWSNLLLETKKIADEAAVVHKRMAEARQKGIEAGVEYNDSLPTLSELIENMENEAAAAMHLHLRGETIWVSYPDKLVRFDWQTGKSDKEIPLKPGEQRFVAVGDELLVERVAQGVTRVNLASGDVRNEDLIPDGPAPTATRLAGKASPTPAGGKTSDAARAQNLSTTARVVLPAVNAAKANQQRLATEMNSATATTAAPTPAPGTGSAQPAGDSRLIVSPNGTYQLTARPLGNKMVDGESVMAHRVTLRRLGAASGAEWTGELPGFPELHSLKTVNVLTAGKALLVLDKSQQKRWEGKLTRSVSGPSRPVYMGETSPSGEGPCAEQGDSLYIYDTAGLTALDLANGASRWTLTMADSTGLFFDAQGMIYLNGIITGGGKAEAVVTKLDPKSGKQLWRVEKEGPVAYVEGKFVYTMESYHGDDDESDGIVGVSTVFHVPAYLRLKRLDATNGRTLWSHHQTRCPLDVQFDKTTIQLLFKKELQTLTYLSL